LSTAPDKIGERIVMHMLLPLVGMHRAPGGPKVDLSKRLAFVWTLHPRVHESIAAPRESSIPGAGESGNPFSPRYEVLEVLTILKPNHRLTLRDRLVKAFPEMKLRLLGFASDVPGWYALIDKKGDTELYYHGFGVWNGPEELWIPRNRTIHRPKN
jgi:hypothetical protein